MIFYFTGTGNSKWIASQIGDEIGDKVFNISDFKEIPNISDEKYIGLVFPIYAWGVPSPMVEFAKQLQQTKAFTFGVCTCGEDAGIAMKKLSKLYHLDSSYSVIMPSNYIVGFDIEDEKIILEKITKAKNEIKTISNEILQTKAVYRVNEGTLAWLKSNLANMGFNRFARTTKPFYANDKCNGCGLCAKSCPASTIKIIDGKPSWNNQCYQCLRCINRCPQVTIQYGKSTESRGRYTIKKYL